MTDQALCNPTVYETPGERLRAMRDRIDLLNATLQEAGERMSQMRERIRLLEATLQEVLDAHIEMDNAKIISPESFEEYNAIMERALASILRGHVVLAENT